MPSAHNGLNAYRQTQVQSRTPLELVVMLYDGALKSMTTACEAIDRRDIPARRDAISRVLAIVSELQSTLNIAEGGQVAASLDELYGFANRRLLDAALKNDAAPINEVRRVFETLRDAWQTIAAPQVAAQGAGTRA
jgi:flagellar secretion chaperone FliS